MDFLDGVLLIGGTVYNNFIKTENATDKTYEKYIQRSKETTLYPKIIGKII